jgi:hypothetical protein
MFARARAYRCVVHCATSRRKVDRLLGNFATVYARCDCGIGPPGDIRRTEVTALQHPPPPVRETYPGPPSLPPSLSSSSPSSPFPDVRHVDRAKRQNYCGRNHPTPAVVEKLPGASNFPLTAALSPYVLELTYSTEFARRTLPRYFSKMADGHLFAFDSLGINGRE